MYHESENYVNFSYSLCEPFQMGGVRGNVTASSVPTIQVSRPGVIKVALPPGAQTIAKMTPQTLAKVPTSSITKVR